MAQTSNRAETVAATVELLSDRLPAFSVTDGPPPELERECIFVGDVETESLGLHTMGTATRHYRLDQFAIHLHIWAGNPGQSASEARARAQEIYAEIDDLFATDSKLSDVDGLLDAVISRQDGPNIEPQDEEGWVGVSTAVVSCRSQLI